MRYNKLAATAYFLLLTTVLFLSGYQNRFGIAPDDFYRQFQQDSEALVLGRIVASEYGRRLPEHANLGYASIRFFAYQPEYILQSYALLGRRALADIKVAADRVETENRAGAAQPASSITVEYNSTLEDYIGRKILLDPTPRVITSITRSGPFASLHVSGPVLGQLDPARPITLSGARVEADAIALTPYLSQFGLQGMVFSELYRDLGGNLHRLYGLNSLAFALTIVALAFLYGRIFPKTFTVLFFLTIVLSPWITSFARNLYWVPFSWFLPAVLAAAWFLAGSRRQRALYGGLLYLAFLAKCLAGYEYISSIILLAAAPFLYAFFQPGAGQSRARAARGFCAVCLIGVAGFASALLIHAGLRGDTLLAGLRSIYELDVKRRTYGDPYAFGSELFAALSASPLSVLKTYILSWHTELVPFVPGLAFAALLLGAALALLYKWSLAAKDAAAEIGLFVAFLLPPISWFVLAKGHSGIHTHINYVLWYFGFVATLAYLCLDGLRTAAHSIHSRIPRAKTDKA